MMNHAFDYNGHVVSQSKPQKVLRTVKKTVTVDSADRDTNKYARNGDWVVYLPRVYKNVISIRLVSATFPQLISGLSSIPGAFSRKYSDNSDTAITATTLPRYFMIDIDGLNKSDECSVGADKSTYSDGYFAIIPNIVSAGGNGTYGTTPNPSAPDALIHYNDKTYQDNVGRYNPPVENLDRMRIRTRLHSQQGGTGFIFWTNDGLASGAKSGICDYQLTFEIEYLENGFDEFSSFETRVGNR